MQKICRLSISAWNRLNNFSLCFGLFRGPLFFFWERISSRPQVFLAQAPDRKPLRLRSKTTDIAAFVQIFVHREYEFELGLSPKVIIDAGANIGFSSIYFSIRYPKSLIIALEPEVGNYELLRQNVALYPNIVAINKALWSGNQALRIIDPGKGKWGFQVQGDTILPKGRVLGTVEGVTLTQIMSDFGLSYVDLVKLDIEGSEKTIFESSETWISLVGVIAIELHDWLNPGCSQSFFQATSDFKHVLRKGENVIVLRDAYWPLELGYKHLV